jgi:hypothetical protein
MLKWSFRGAGWRRLASMNGNRTWPHSKGQQSASVRVRIDDVPTIIKHCNTTTRFVVQNFPTPNPYLSPSA